MPASTTEVPTTAAVASVHSTDWTIETGPDSAAAVEGAVAVRNPYGKIGGSVVPRSGDRAVVPIGRAPAPPNR